MRINPSIVIGLGSSGCHVVANLERIIYEVVGETRLDLFRLISLDTDTRAKDDEPPPCGKRSVSYSAHSPDTGQAIRDLTQKLGDDFSWCPPRLTIEGEGAGNLRAGGRLLLFDHFARILSMIRDAALDVRTAAMHGETARLLHDQLERRGIPPVDNLIHPTQTVVYVVGTLAGGTCSGMCVDLGYAIRNVAPEAERIGMFLLPDRNEAPAYLENTWATLKDLEYFCDNPSSFRSVWISEAGAKVRYQADSVLPYNYAYLLSPTNEAGVLRMPYHASSDSPLVVMASMQLAACLFGMRSHISASHVNLQNQVQTKPKNRFFLNANLRAVSYPKYEISEGAACRMIDEKVCARWLNRDNYMSTAGVVPIDEDKAQGVGRNHWNDHFNAIWEGLGADVDIKQHVGGFLRKTATRPDANLLHQITSPNQGTIYSQVAAKLRDRREKLQLMIKGGLGRVFEDSQNVRCAELYLQGVKAELENTVRFWNAVGTPARGDQDSWSSRARSLVQEATGKQRLLSWALAAREELLTEEFGKIVTRLQMYLMTQTLSEVLAWIDTDLTSWLGTLRRSVEAVQDIAANRRRSIAARMMEVNGPILKIGRSRTESLQVEIEELGNAEPHFDRPLLASLDGNFTGIFAVKERPGPNDNRQIFINLKNALQPARLRALEDKGHVDLVTQIRNEGRTSQVVDHFKDAQAMSLATRIGLKKSPAAVPSFVLGVSQDSARLIMEEMRTVMGNPPVAVPQPLPMFDHMVLFYQEGACSVQPEEEYQSIPDVLSDANIYREHFNSKMKMQSDSLDPLAGMKTTASSTSSGARQ